MAKIITQPDGIEFDVAPGETILDAARRAGIAWASACGGRAKCSTCRVRILDGLKDCPKRSPDEAMMAEKLVLDDHVRLACQVKPAGDLRVRRLVLDETDLAMTSQLDRAAPTRTGDVQNVTIFFSDINDFTSISEALTAYDVLYLLNRYFTQAGEIIEQNGGYVDKFMGDGIMAIFGLDGAKDASIRAVNAALQTLAAVDRLKSFFSATYDLEFDVRIGLHYGETLIGSVGSLGNQRLTAIGDVVNVASRVEAANKDAGTRLLISEALHDQVADQIKVEDFVRTRLRGTSDRITLYEIAGLKREVENRLSTATTRDTMRMAGREWRRVLPADALANGERHILQRAQYNVVVVRADDLYYAFNNACPHLNLPFFDIGEVASDGPPVPPDSVINDQRGVVCRWHQSRFDLQTGEIRIWCPVLNENGTAPGFEFVGDVSKNRRPLVVYPCRVHDGSLWISFQQAPSA